MNHKSNLLIAVKVLCGIVCLASQAMAQPPEPTIAAVTTARLEPAALPLMTVEELNRAIGGPTMLTLKLANASARETFEEVRKQTGIPISAYVASQWATIKNSAPVNIARQPFLPAMRKLQHIWNLHLESYSIRPGLTVMPGADTAGDRTVSAGLCLFSITGLNYGRSVSFAADGKAVLSSDFNISARAFLDPKVPIFRGTTTCQIDEAVDEKGRSLRSDDAPATPLADANPIRLNLKLQSQLGAAKKLAKLKGTLGFVATAQREVWEVPNVLQAHDVAKTILIDGIEERFSVDAVRKEGDEYHVQVTTSLPRSALRRIVRLSNGRSLVLAQNIPYEQVRLVDGQNRDWQRVTYRIQNQGDKETSIVSTTLIFRKAPTDDSELGVPAKLIIAVPTQWREVRVPFEFKDLPLP